MSILERLPSARSDPGDAPDKAIAAEALA